LTGYRIFVEYRSFDTGRWVCGSLVRFQRGERVRGCVHGRYVDGAGRTPIDPPTPSLPFPLVVPLPPDRYESKLVGRTTVSGEFPIRQGAVVVRRARSTDRSTAFAPCCWRAAAAAVAAAAAAAAAAAVAAAGSLIVLTAHAAHPGIAVQIVDAAAAAFARAVHHTFCSHARACTALLFSEMNDANHLSLAVRPIEAAGVHAPLIDDDRRLAQDRADH
jgi:hypothetical protein